MIMVPINNITLCIKKSGTILALTFVLNACNSHQKNTTVNTDSAAYQVNATVETAQDPFEKIRDFRIDFMSPEYTSLINELKANKRLEVASSSGIEGDVSPIKVTLFRDSITNSEFLVSELNMGDEGFGIHQFFIKNDSLLKARTYAIAPNQSGSGFKVEEEILDFTTDKFEVLHRIKDVKTSDATLYNLSDVPFKKNLGNRQKLLKEYTHLFNDMKAPVKK